MVNASHNPSIPTIIPIQTPVGQKEEKRLKRLANNRVCAQKTRDRKKIELKELKDKVKEYQNVQIPELNALISQLKYENQELQLRLAQAEHNNRIYQQSIATLSTRITELTRENACLQFMEAGSYPNPNDFGQ